MEDILKNFLEEVDDIEKSSLFMEDDDDEPTTEWVEEIDPRTNFPFYWNSTTKESVWDKPESFDEYLVDYERYLKNVMDLQCIERAREQHEDNMKKINDMRGLLTYSDSEDECVKEEVVEEDVKVMEEADEIVECEPEESITSKKERWMAEQIILARQYLHNLVKGMSETALAKLQLLPKDIQNSETLTSIALRVQTRLEDWEGGHLTIERTVEKLQEALVAISKFEGDIESVNWKLQWNGDTMKYYFVNTITGKKKLSFSNSKSIYEDGEIVDDDEDLTSDLHEYVISTLHRSLQEEDQVLAVDTPEMTIKEDAGECIHNAANLQINKTTIISLTKDLQEQIIEDTEQSMVDYTVVHVTENADKVDDNSLVASSVDNSINMDGNLESLIVENQDVHLVESISEDKEVETIEDEEVGEMDGEEVDLLEGNGGLTMEDKEINVLEDREVLTMEDKDVQVIDYDEEVLIEDKEFVITDDKEVYMMDDRSQTMEDRDVNMIENIDDHIESLIEDIKEPMTLNKESTPTENSETDNNRLLINEYQEELENIADESTIRTEGEEISLVETKEPLIIKSVCDDDAIRDEIVSDEQVQFKSLVDYLDDDEMTDEDSQQ